MSGDMDVKYLWKKIVCRMAGAERSAWTLMTTDYVCEVGFGMTAVGGSRAPKV